MKQVCVRVLLISTLILFSGSAFSGPLMINYQGKIESGGTPFHGTGEFQFAMMDATGTVCLWSNDSACPPAATVSIAVNNGLYHVILGDTAIMNAIPATVFDTDEVYLRIWFDDGVNGLEQLAPDQRITSSGYAVKANDSDLLNGQAASEFAAASHTHPASDISGGSGSGLDADLLDGYDSTDFMPAGTDNWVDSAGDTMTGPLNLPADGLAISGDQLVASGGYLGIGTAGPTESLDVDGRIRVRDLPVDAGLDSIVVADANGVLHSRDAGSLGGTGSWTEDGDDIYNSNSGNVGIGTSSVTAKLTVQNLDDTQAAFLVQQNTTSTPYSGFVLTVGKPGFYETSTSISTTSDNGCVVTGNTMSYGAGSSDMYILKFDAGNSLEWSRTIGGTGSDIGYCVRETSDNGFIVTGHTYSFGAGESDVLLVKLDSAGSLTWARTAGGTALETGRSVIETSDNGFLVCGDTASYGSGSTDILLLKYDSSGNLTWCQTSGGLDTDYSRAVCETYDNSYVVTGYTYSFGAGGSDIILIKYDSMGSPTWIRTIGGVNNDYAHSVMETSGTDLLVGGSTASFGLSSYDAFIFMIDSGGNLVWARAVGETGGDYCYSTLESSDGGFILAGSTQSFGAGGDDGFLVKLDPGLNLSWAVTIGLEETDTLISVSEMASGDLLLSGFCYVDSYSDILIAKTTSTGQIGSCELLDTCAPLISSPAVSPSVAPVSTLPASPDTSIHSPTVGTEDMVVNTLCATESKDRGLKDIFTISNRGKVGIGISNPISALHVNGDLMVTGYKNFAIDHPLHPDTQLLVHAALEGPEAAVYYRGEARLTDGDAAVILPKYFEALTRPEGRTVQLTPIADLSGGFSPLAAGRIENGQFTVYGQDDRFPDQAFYWEVKALRADVEVLKPEQMKSAESGCSGVRK